MRAIRKDSPGLSAKRKCSASLNHPNIAQIYAIEEVGGIRALIMELVPGETLKGPVPLPEALRAAGQIADALQAAHDKGIVHRDLKPANIIITPQGVVKVLDFGLAKLTESVVSSGDPRNSPTLTMGATQAGVVMGTAAYMAPEQARGQQDVDRRADIWAFGVVLYEMLTGKQLFHGGTISDILASVLKVEPDLEQAPPKLQPLLRSCLQKEPRLRLQAIGDWVLLVGDAPTSASSRRISRLGKLAGLAATLLAVIAAIAGWDWWRSTRPVDRPLMRLSVDLGPDAVTSADITVAISRDGTRLVFPVRGKDGKQQLATRLLDQTAATMLPGTEGASDPFFSPDGQWVGFFADSKLKKISMLGGAPVTLCDADKGWGASWGEDGSIIAALSTISAGLSRISAAGGTPQKVTTMSGVRTNERWPQVLPGGKAVVFTASNSLSTFENATIEAVSLRTGQRKTLVKDAYFGRYFSDGRSGYLVYIHDNALFGLRFDPDQVDLRGTPTQLLEDVTGDQASGAGQFDFSQTGTFVYRSGKAPDQVWPVAWLDSSGKVSPLISKSAAYTTPRFSPDGQLLALAIGQSRGRDIFVYDWRRDAMLRLTSAVQGNSSLYPVWAPDGKHIAYRSTPSSGGSSIEWLRSDGSGVGQRLFESKNLVQPYSFSPDGRLLAYFQASPGKDTSIWTIRLEWTDPDHPKTGKPELFLSSTASGSIPSFRRTGAGSHTRLTSQEDSKFTYVL